MNIDDFKNKIESFGFNKVYEDIIKKAKDSQKTINPFVTIIENFKESSEESIINNIPYSLKDNFSTKGILTTASSNILKDYIPVYDSTVYKKLKESGAKLIGKTVMDELAMGGTGTTGHTGIVRNPHDITRMIGGSSAGSAASVALGIVPFSIGSDTGDSVRKPASFGGVVGFKPTYGRISRFGLFAFASSLDHVGIISACVKDAAVVTDVLKGKDSKDMTSLPDEEINYFDSLENPLDGKKLCYIKEIIDEDENKEVFNNVLEKCKVLNMNIYEEHLDKRLLSSIYGTYYAISCAEATSNNANLTGIIYGPRGKGNNSEEIIINSRTEGFSELIKRRFVIGSYVLKRENQEKLYLNACRIRRLITNEINKLFEKYDAIILPTTKDIAPKFNNDKEVLNDKSSIIENHLIIGNFGGYPSITIPSGKKENMPLGVNIMCNICKDDLVLNIAYKLEKELKYGGEK